MRYVLGFAAIMSLLTMHARGGEYVVTNHCSKFEVTNKCPAPAKAGKLYNASHVCPSCGASQYVVAREGNGEHSHRCGSCGTEWWHADPGRTYSLPQSVGGCEGGNCPSPSRSRGLIFRR